MSEDRWMTIESAPKDHQPILVWLGEDYVEPMMAALFDRRGKQGWTDLRGQGIDDPTHWQPLPEPPEES